MVVRQPTGFSPSARSIDEGALPGPCAAVDFLPRSSPFVIASFINCKMIMRSAFLCWKMAVTGRPHRSICRVRPGHGNRGRNKGAFAKVRV
jgi:hypothetical protein